MVSDLVLEIPVRYTIRWPNPPLTAASPTPPRGPGGVRAMLRALGDAARSPALALAVLGALVLLYGERSSEALAAIVDRTAEAIAAALP